MSRHAAKLLTDGRVLVARDCPIGTLAPGTHTMTIRTDTTNPVAEVPKNDHE